MFTRLLLSAGLLLGAAMTVSEAKAERRVALVIGNSGYAHATALRNPRNDAADMAEVLKTLGFEVVLGHDLSQQQFAQSIERYARILEDADVGLFFYAGHGLQVNDKNYLVSTNAKLDNEFLISSETIELDAIIKLMESKATTNLVFLDACRNNPLTENLRRNLAAMKRNASLGRGLARVEVSGRDTLVAFAAAPGQEAADGAERNSPFTTALIKHLPRPGVEVSVMLKEVAADVRRDTQNAQRPQQLSDMSRTFYFAKAEPAVATRVDAGAEPARPAVHASSAGAETRSLDVAFWNAAQSSNDCEAVRAYLQRFPEGIFVELAKLSERRLCAGARRVTVVDASPGAPAAGLTSPATSMSPATPAAPTPPATTMAALPDQAAAPVAPSVTRPAETLSGVELTRTVQLELMRVGCGALRADGQWKTSSKEAVRLFNKHTRTKLSVDEPSMALVKALREHDDRVCPLQCDRGFQARGNTCVAVQREPVKTKKKQAERTRAVERTRSVERTRAVEDRPAHRRHQIAAPQPQPQPQMVPMMGPPMGGMGIMFMGRRGFRF
jgi:uncharacterized caspase-like protein